MTRTRGIGEPRLRRAVEGLFRPSDPAREAVGIEVEVIPVDRETGARIPPVSAGGPAFDPVLRSLAVSEGWTPGPSLGGGLPTWTLPGGGRLTWEPGGQLEYASPALDDPFYAVDGAAGLVRTLAGSAAERGIELLARGIDPDTRVEETTLLLDSPRYARMTGHYRRRGPEGERMMRLTAGIHVNLDLGRTPLRRWRAANRLVPALSAAFANAPRRADAETPWRSHRAEQWRALDPTRTGTFPADDPVAEYVAFAAGAEAFLLGPPDAPAEPFARRAASATDLELSTHLTTLFPEVRPRRYLELRFFDALPIEGYALVVAAATGLLLDDEHSAWACDLPVPDRDRLVRAGRDGVRDAELRSEATEALERAAERAPRSERESDARVRLAAFLDAFTRRGRDPGDAPAHRVESILLPPAGSEVRTG